MLIVCHYLLPGIEMYAQRVNYQLRLVARKWWKRCRRTSTVRKRLVLPTWVKAPGTVLPVPVYPAEDKSSLVSQWHCFVRLPTSVQFYWSILRSKGLLVHLIWLYWLFRFRPNRFFTTQSHHNLNKNVNSWHVYTQACYPSR